MKGLQAQQRACRPRERELRVAERTDELKQESPPLLGKRRQLRQPWRTARRCYRLRRLAGSAVLADTPCERICRPLNCNWWSAPELIPEGAENLAHRFRWNRPARSERDRPTLDDYSLMNCRVRWPRSSRNARRRSPRGAIRDRQCTCLLAILRTSNFAARHHERGSAVKSAGVRQGKQVGTSVGIPPLL